MHEEGALDATVTLCSSLLLIRALYVLFLLHSAPTATEKRSRNVPCADAHRTVPPFANVKIGRAIRWSV